MSTAAAIGVATYTGANGSNGTIAAGKAAYPNDSISAVIGVANLTNPPGSAVTSVPVADGGVNGMNGTIVAARPAPGTMGTQGPAASNAFPPTYNPGS